MYANNTKTVIKNIFREWNTWFEKLQKHFTEFTFNIPL